MRASALYHSVPLLSPALTPAINAAYDAIAKPHPTAEGAVNSESTNDTTGGAPSKRTHYRINGPGSSPSYTPSQTARGSEVRNNYTPPDDTHEPELKEVASV